MAIYQRGQKRNILTFVKCLNPNLYYGWNTKDLSALPGVSNADLIALGHITPQSLLTTSNAIAILGANRPTPPRAIKIINENPDQSTQGKASTYMGVGSEGTALAAGWKMSGGVKKVNIRQSGRSVTVAVPCNGGYYAFPMNAGDVTTYAGELGLLLPANITGNERARLFSGATRPRPPRVQKQLNTGKFSSFCDPAKLDDLLQAGWSEIESEIQLVIAAVP
jgi:hypothetical protein